MTNGFKLGMLKHRYANLKRKHEALKGTLSMKAEFRITARYMGVFPVEAKGNAEVQTELEAKLLAKLALFEMQNTGEFGACMEIASVTVDGKEVL